MPYVATNALLKGIQTRFSRMLEGSKAFTFAPLAEITDSKSNYEDYLVFDGLPGIQEWTDKINFSSIKDLKLRVHNENFARGMMVDRNTIADGMINPTIETQLRGIVRRWNSFPSKMLNQLLVANATTFDNTAFFANSRPNINTGSNIIDNLYSGTSGGPYTYAQFEADYAGARQQLLGFKDADGDPMNEGASLVVLVPNHLADLANRLLSVRADRIYDGTAEKSNIYAGTAQVIVNSYQLATSDDWYIMNIDAPIKPLLVQRREAPVWAKEESELERMIKFGTTARFGFALLNPTAAIKIDN